MNVLQTPKRHKLFFLLLILLNATNLYSQIANFTFDNGFDDVVNGYAPSNFGQPALITDDGNQVLQLEGDEYIVFPTALNQSIDPTQDVEIQIKFKITDTYDDVPYSGTGELGENGKRILISNKGHFVSYLGFDIFVDVVDGEYRILMSITSQHFSNKCTLLSINKERK